MPINTICRKSLIFICTLAILFSNTMTVHAYDYNEQGTNDYEINENESLSEQEIDNIRESLQDEEDASSSQSETNDLNDKEPSNISNKRPLLLLSPPSPPSSSDPENTINNWKNLQIMV